MGPSADLLSKLCYGDNLDVLKRHVADASIDLVYLDPPFNSQREYNVLFKERTGALSAAQIQTFQDFWQWGRDSERVYEDIVIRGGQLSQAMQAFWTLFPKSNLLAYLTMMAPRLVELRRVLKETGSIWLHCDPTASHYLKVLMDAVFGAQHFRNEVIWQRSMPKGHAFTRFPSAHDVLLYYGKGSAPTWNPQYTPHRPEYLESHYSNVEPQSARRYMLDNCLNPNRDRPNLTYEWQGLTRVWRWTKDRMQALHEEGRLVYSKSGMPRYKRYLDEMSGTPVTSVWADIPPINSQAQERLGYQTQKPEALLERIISASSNEGDWVLDPFCGCGTAVAVAQRLKRRWIGIDITQAAFLVIKPRLKDVLYKIIGEPTSRADAEALAAENPHQFEWWALGLVDARPTEPKKGADRGIDGRIYFHDDDSGQTRQIVLQVKSGHVSPAQIQSLHGAMEQERAQIGVFITLQLPTAAMRKAASAGFYQSPWGKHPRLQILTIDELLAGAKIDYPPARQVNVKYGEPLRPAAQKTEQMEITPATTRKLAKAPSRSRQAPRRRRRRAS